ncbi:MAG: undecaprenyl/decaprenyl-phosphate alpha-N-acetylglucosaminyl 1-phosphate transferase [Clostridia bacterium]|nr:undecaprenyl/decaprenyl-phosphate alpha-N-acetylglucosaminyl 1-phosphate transferase [Clostridia bacterium]
MPGVIQAAIISFLLAFALTPVVRRVALRIGVVDRPGERSVHTRPVPLLGGVAIFLAFGAGVAATGGLSSLPARGILAGGALMLVVGIVDDYRPLRPAVKLAGQLAAAVVLLFAGVRIDFVTNPWGGLLALGPWAYPLTLLWVVAIINVVNLMDGLDGLAAGVTSIACVTLALVAWQTQQPLEAVLLIAALAGSALGFLPYNFNPARIFMGDAGSMFLGYVLAAVSVEGSVKSPAAVALAVPLLVLGLPIADTFLAILRRLQSGRPVGQADRDHLHHRLLRLGLNQREAVLWMYMVTGWLGVSALAVVGVNPRLGFAIVAFVALSLYLMVRQVGMAAVRSQQKGFHS